MKRGLITMTLLQMVCLASFAQAQSKSGELGEVARPTGGLFNFLEPVLPDRVMQHSKEIYVLYGCAYCHGVDLKVRNGEASDLLHSKLIGLDDDGSLIVPLLKAGIPQTPKLSPMPQFADLSDGEFADIVRWIHYSRATGVEKELKSAPLPAASVDRGKDFYQANCASCHVPGSLTPVVHRLSDVQKLQAAVMHPGAFTAVPSLKLSPTAREKLEAGRQKHQKILENMTPESLSDITAYLQTMH